MYVHKYTESGDTFYRVSKGSGKPAKTVTLTVSDWSGKVSENSGNVGRAIAFLKDAPWSVKEKEIEEKEEKEEKKEKKKASISSYIRTFTESLK